MPEMSHECKNIETITKKGAKGDGIMSIATGSISRIAQIFSPSITDDNILRRIGSIRSSFAISGFICRLNCAEKAKNNFPQILRKKVGSDFKYWLLVLAVSIFWFPVFRIIAGWVFAPFFNNDIIPFIPFFQGEIL